MNNYTSEGEHASSESVLVMEPMFVLPRNGTEDGFVFEFTVTAVGQNGNGPPSLLVRTNFSTLQPGKLVITVCSGNLNIKNIPYLLD